MKPYALPLFVFAAGLVPLPLLGQNPLERPKAVHITLHPMAEPRPALKYRLLPSLLDCRPGNAAVWWNRIPAERSQLFSDRETWFAVYRWMDLPLGNPEEKRMRDKDPAIRKLLEDRGLYRDMVHAAQFESCDWQLPIHEGNFIEMAIPDLGQLRGYGVFLAGKARLDGLDGRYAEAIETIQTGFALARDAGKGQVLVSPLVGAAIASQMTVQIEQLIQQPLAPNLYWALATLRRPLVDFWPGFDAEWNFLYLQFPDLRDLDKKDLSADEWRNLLDKTVDGASQLGMYFENSAGSPLNGRFHGQSARTARRILTTALALQCYPAAKQYLRGRGRAAAEVEAMPVAKAILIASVEIYQDLDDQAFKTVFLPYAEGEKCSAAANKVLSERISRHEDIIPFTYLLLPAYRSVRVAQARLEWNLARLRIFEALRIYAAGHAGRLPERLDDTAEVPIPRNPFDDKPFDYRREGDRAVLTCQDGPPALPWRYEITMLPAGDK